jgi:hypothetical protein
MNRYLLTSLLILGLASPAFAAYQLPAQSRLSVGSYGHPDPCWSLRIKRMETRDPYWRSLFEGCLARYNYNN